MLESETQNFFDPPPQNGKILAPFMKKHLESTFEKGENAV